MHRIVALILLALLPLQGTLPGQAMACATDARSMTSTDDDAAVAAQADEHDHARASAGGATAEHRASSPVGQHDAPRSDGKGHCLTSVCIAPALAAISPVHGRTAPPAGDPSPTVVTVLHSAAPAPDTPPPRG